jgi:hypothetical protein
MPANVTGTGTWPRRIASTRHDEAERQHRAAAAAHEAAMATPMDTFSAEVAMRASNRADQASRDVGVNPSTDWPSG